jgi:protein-L-isoaspartate(D-aspartate) O-methyltransferase
VHRLIGIVAFLSCCQQRPSPAPAPADPSGGAAGNERERAAAKLSRVEREGSDSPDPAEAKRYRRELIAQILERGDVTDPKVIDAASRVPRHAFVPEAPLDEAYEDHPLPIGHDQTISQPSLVALMTQSLELEGDERVLEIGTGSGYQAAVLSLLAKQVYSIEIVPELGEQARKRLAELGYSNVSVRIGDGYRGWPELAPFDRILLTAAPPEIPATLVSQLADGGVMVAPVGATDGSQTLYRYRKRAGKLEAEELGAVRFVPMVPEK